MMSTDHNHSDNAGKMIMAFFSGALIGSTFSLLFAPTSGRRLRRTIERKGQRLRLDAADSAAAMRDRGEEIADRVGEALQDTAQEVRRAVRSVAGR